MMKKSLFKLFLLVLITSMTGIVVNGQSRPLTKSVSPIYMAPGGTATYTFTIGANSSAVSNIGFTDNLPSGLRIASTPNVVVNSNLTGGIVTATAGGTSITVSGYSLAANLTGTIRVNITDSGSQINTTCGSNPAAFTNTAANITGATSSITNNVGNICLIVAPACPAGVITTQPSTTSQNLCINEPSTPITVVANDAISYQWYSAKTSTDIGSLIPGATSATYIHPTTSSSLPAYYYVLVSTSTCIVESTRTVITVAGNPTFTTNLTTGTQTVCQNVTPSTLSVAASGVTYQWYSNTTNSNSGGTAIAGATSSTYTPPASGTPGTTYYYVVIQTSGGRCTTASNVRAVTVASSPTPAITAQPNTTPQSVCVNGTLTPLSVTATNATSYQWYYSSAASGGTAITVSGATSSTYTPSTAFPFSTRYYYVTVSNSCGSVTSSPRTPIIVNAAPSSIDIYPPSQTTTLNSTPYNISISNNGSVPLTTYQWYSNTVNSTTGGTLIPGATSITYTPLTNALGTTYYYVVVGSSAGCTTVSPIASITVETCTAANPVSVNLNTTFNIPVAPSGAVKQWHSSATPSASTLISSGIVMATPTPKNYWVYYYDATNNCYSPGTKVVVVSNTCCNNPTFDLTTLPQSTPPAGSTLVWYTTNNHQSGSKVNNPTIANPGIYFPFFYDSVNNCFSPVGTPVAVGIDDICSVGSCYKPGLLTGGTILDTKVGVSAMGRAGADDRDNWPMTRKGGHIALESKTKAFVPNRVAFDASRNPIGIVAANFVEGMMVYDTTNKCLKIYTLKEGDSAMAWHCFTTPACPE